MLEDVWNPWHGCHKYSEGCKNCYVYRRDGSVGKDASIIEKTNNFNLPIKCKRDGSYKILGNTTLYTCMTSDFFIKEADEWRAEAWNMIRRRQDINFIIITKRIVRFLECIPNDWGKGYPNVTICCTMENQKECDTRFPIFNSLPIARKFVICEPLLSDIDMSNYLNASITQVVVGGESGNEARVCDYSWVLNIRSQCIKAGVPFHFKQTGAYLKKEGHIYRILRKYQHSQARKAKIDT
jgi:protein gp37